MLPILIKKYQDGYFTSQFLQLPFQGSIAISSPRGRGLSLHDLPPGRVILLAGGTGLYPFSDTVDLVYKEHLVESGHSLANAVRSNDPLVGGRPFRDFKFTLYMAVNELDELHPITLFQCNELSRAGKLNCMAKIKKMDLVKMQQKYPSISLLEGRF